MLSSVQGLTEFLPVSSSGHLVILQKFFRLSEPPILFDILVHVGTLGAVFYYFFQPLKEILIGLSKKEKESVQIAWLIVVGSIPAAIFGGLFEKQIEMSFNSLRLVGAALLVTAGLLFSTKAIMGKLQTKEIERLGWKGALVVGILQALAILPGVSRSGSTIVAGLWQGLSPKSAFAFSFYLAIPAILGALALKSNELLISPQDNLVQGLVGMVLAGIVGYFVLRALERVLRSARFWYFGFYCLFLGLAILLI